MIVTFFQNSLPIDKINSMGGSGSISGMIQSLKFNKQQKSKRKRMNEWDRNITSGTYGSFKDHTNMKGHEFASFQKDLYAKRKAEKRKNQILILLAFVLTPLLMWLIPTLILWLLEGITP